MPSQATNAPVDLMCALVVRGAFDAAVVPAFEASGGAFTIAWSPTTLIMKGLAEGRRPDAVLVLSSAMDTLVRDGLVDAASRVEVARSRNALAVRAGAPHPPIATVEALKRTLTDARSVAFSKSGASGIYFDALLSRLGLADAVRAKATIIPTGFTAERLVTGEADIAVQQMSELLVVDGVEVIGPFPDPVQEVTTFSAAIMREAANRAGAERLLAAMTAADMAEAYRESGLEAAYVCARRAPQGSRRVRHVSPSSVVPAGLYSQPIQPA